MTIPRTLFHLLLDTKQNQKCTLETIKLLYELYPTLCNLCECKAQKQNIKSYVGCLMNSRISRSVEEEDKERGPNPACPLSTGH